MANLKFLFSFIILFLLISTSLGGKQSMADVNVIRVGVVLDLNSTVGEMAASYISMAVSDFYAVNANYQTRLTLFTRDSKDDVVGAACAALDLMKNEKVHAIIGPQRSAQAKFVADLGEKAQVPILSFSTTSPFLSLNHNPFFIQTTQDDFGQVKAITSLVQAYGWREVFPIYEDTDYGNGLILYLKDAFQEVDIRFPYRSLIHPSSKDSDILKELKKLKAMKSKIFLVHMTASLGSKLFVLVKNSGMMSKGYAWIITQGLSSLLDPIDSKVMDSMQGVLGIRPYIPISPNVEDFERRLAKNFTSSRIENLFGFRAYDTIWALAMAVEKANIKQNSSFLKQNASESKVDLAAIGVSEMGPRLLNTIRSTEFKGLGGYFRLVKGQLEASAFEIFNVIGNTERIIGYWNPKKERLSQEADDNSTTEIGAYSISQPIWPGGITDQPKKLRIGVPSFFGFNEFLKVEWHPDQNDKPKISGISIDLFHAVLDMLPFPLPHEFVPYVNQHRQSAGTYDELLQQIKHKNFDAVVGDTTIMAYRSSYVDFTLPYSESGVSMVVSMKDNEKKNMWIFLKPLSWDLWLAIGAVSIFIGLLTWVLEHRVNTKFRGPPDQQIGTIFLFSFATLTSSNREKMVNNWSRFMLIIWAFMVLILTQSYTASLTSMLTVQQLKPEFVDVTVINRNGYFVGYHEDSFVRELLVKQLNINESKLKPYRTPEEYHEALSKGSHNGGVAAIFDEIPYIRLFLSKYGSRYAMVGQIYKTDGFGFAFPLKSPLVSYISRPILNVTQDKDKMTTIMRKYFASQTTCVDGSSAEISSYSPSLGVYSFGGLFIIVGVASICSLLIYLAKFLHFHWPASNIIPTEGSFWLRLIELVKHFDQKDICPCPFRRNESKLNPTISSSEGFGPSPSIESIDYEEKHSRTSSEGADNVAIDENEQIFSSRHGDTSIDVASLL
ncbi:glutamate receptor 2.8-like [Fagus crenata]